MADRDRALAPRGRAAAPLMGRYMQEQSLHPDHVIVSNAVRTRETWSLVRQALQQEAAVVFDEQIYEASPGDIIAAIATAPERAKTLLVVGHNPGLQAVAVTLGGAGDRDARERVRDQFPTAALAVIDLDIPDWAAIRPAGGRLVQFVTPRAIAGASH